MAQLPVDWHPRCVPVLCVKDTTAWMFCTAAHRRGVNVFGVLVLIPLFALAQVPSAIVTPGSNLKADVAPNGVTVVDINAANSAGLSHNKYDKFNVNPTGLVLNNTTADRIAWHSQLAGQVTANFNQATAARVILNEVVSNNRSTLAGFTEVLGGKADVILANPYGITCTGCGFINTDRVTLTTGNPFLTYSGALGGLNVGQGDILITGSGLNAKAQQVFDLVTRSVRIDAPVNGNDVSIVTGANRWNYDTRAVTGTVTPTGSTPVYSVDSSALGGMYANRIRLTSTEAGLGVRMLGDVAASAGDFTLSAAGKVELHNRISASNDITVSTTATDAAALSLTDASLISTGKTDLVATGGVVVSGGALIAGRDLSVRAASLVDSASASGIANNNMRHAGNALTLVVNDAASLGATGWHAVGAWKGSFGILTTTGATRLSSSDSTLMASVESGDLGLGLATLQSAGDMMLKSSGKISTATDGALQSKSGNLSLTAGNGISNAGTLTADKGALTIRAVGEIDNSGQIHAGQNLDIADGKGGATVSVKNNGKLLADGGLVLKAAAVDNTAAARIQAQTGSTVDAATIDNAGVWLLSQQAAAADTVTVGGTLNNSGTLQSAGSETIGTRQITNTGKLIAADQLRVNVTDGLSNASTSAVVQAGKQLSVQGSGAAVVTSAGSKMLGDGLNMDVATIDNRGTIQGGTRSDSTVTAAGTLNNRAGGVISAATSSSGGATVSAEKTVNAGTIQSAGTLALEVGAGGLTSNGTLIAERDLALRSRVANTDYIATVNGLMQSRSGMLAINGTANSTLNIGATGTVVGQQVSTQLGTVALANGATLSSDRDMTLSMDTLTLAGAKSAVLGSTDQTAPVGSPWQTRISTSTVLTNNGLLFSDNDLTVSGPTIVNGLSGGISALHDLDVTATSGNLLNQGALYAGNALKASAVSGTLTNAATLSAHQGTISAGKAVTLNADTLINNSTIDSNGSITITARDLRNEVVGGDTRVDGPESAKAKSQTGHEENYSFPNNHEYWHYAETWHNDQTYSAGGGPTIKPQITGAGTVTLNFNTGKNLGGVISGDTLTLKGTGSGATFVNDDLALKRTNYKRTWTEHTKYVAYGSATYYDRDVESDTLTNTVEELGKLGASIYVRTLSGSDFALTNNGSTAQVAAVGKGDPKSADIKSRDGGNVNKGTVGAASGATAGVSSITFGGISIALPTNPNGLYVIAKDPRARYQVESNPRYQIGYSTVGSNYLAKLLGYDADTLMRRLGDSSYEAYLIKQQLIAQTGNGLLTGGKDVSAQVKKGLMESAAGESKMLGLTYGNALTPEQQSKLTHNFVWMVKTEINGQTVLAPVVYLSQTTKASVVQGAVIKADTAKLSVASLTNSGGTIAGTKSLSVVSKGDVRDISGTIKGGDVAVTSTQGNIINQTASSGSGSDQRYVTDIGKTASIQSTGTLSLDAAKDITNTGATVAAGGDASLKAGGNATFDTIQDKSIDTTHGTFSQDGGTGRTTTTTTTIAQVKSGLSSGGNLSIDAGKALTLAGTDTKATGNADLKAGSDLNIVARENSKTSHTESSASGFGMNNSLFGSTTVTTDSTSVRNVGSTLQVGGNASLTAKNDITGQGSNVDVNGNGLIKAGNGLNVLAGRDYDETRTTTERTGLLQVSASGSASADATMAFNSGAGNGKASASASLDAKANASGAAGLALLNTTKTTTETTDLRHVGSNVKFRGDLAVNASRDVNFQGSKVDAGGDLKVEAKNVNLLAAEDKKTSTTRTENLSIGLMASSDNTASAHGSAEAGGGAQKNINANGKVGVSGQVSASSENRIDVMQYTTTTESTLDTTHKVSSITAGRDLSVKASKNLVSEGGQLAAGRDVEVDANKMEFKAINDVHEKTSSSSKTTAGLYLSGTASASVEAGAGVGAGVGAQASATGQAQARAEVGYYVANTRSDKVEGSTTAVTSGISAGRDIKRTARDSIVDVGTKSEAGRDLVQLAKTINSLAAADTKYSSSSNTTDTAKVGAYAEATANASAGLTRTEASASAAAGFTASYKREGTTSARSSSQAVVSNIKVEGNVRSTSTNKTELEGTVINAKKDADLKADTLDYRAARNTSTQSETTTSAGRTFDVSVVGSVGVNINASYTGSEQSALSSQAVAGSIKSGGNLSIRTGDAYYEGTNLEAGGRVDLIAEGKTTFDAATNHGASKMHSVGVNVGVSVGGKGRGVDIGAQVKVANSSHYQEIGGSVKSGSGPINIQSGKDAFFTGVTFDAGKSEVMIASAGDLSFKAAHDRQESLSVGASAGISASGGKNKSASKFAGISKNQSETGAPNAALDLEKTSSDTVTGTEIRSSGKVILTAGKNANLENMQVTGTTDVQETAGGRVEKSTLKSTSDGFGVVGYAPEIVIPNKDGKGSGGKPSSGASENTPRSPHKANGDSTPEAKPPALDKSITAPDKRTPPPAPLADKESVGRFISDTQTHTLQLSEGPVKQRLLGAGPDQGNANQPPAVPPRGATGTVPKSENDSFHPSFLPQVVVPTGGGGQPESKSEQGPAVPPLPDHLKRPAVPSRDGRAAQSVEVTAPVERPSGPAPTLPSRQGRDIAPQASATGQAEGNKYIPTPTVAGKPVPIRETDSAVTSAQKLDVASQKQPPPARKSFNPSKDLGDGRKGEPLSSIKPHYDQRIVVQAGADEITRIAARRLADKHESETVLVTPQELHNLLESSPELLSPGKIKVSVVGHVDKSQAMLDKRNAEDIAGLVAGTNTQDGQHQLAKVSLVGCESNCLRDEVKQSLSDRGIESKVTGKDTSIKILDSGKAQATGVDDPDALGLGDNKNGRRASLPAWSSKDASNIIPDQEKTRKKIAKNFILDTHIPAIGEASIKEKFAATFRAAGAATLKALSTGAGAKGHDVLEKTIKSSSIMKAYPSNATEILEKVRAAGIEGYVGHWDRQSGQLAGIYTTVKSEDGSREIYPINVADIANSMTDLKNRPEWEKLPLTGDYDMHDILVSNGAGRPRTPLVGSKEERKVIDSINAAVATVDSTRTFEDLEHNVVRHGPQVNFPSYMLAHESTKVKENGGFLAAVARPGDFPLAAVNRGNWSIIKNIEQLDKFYRDIGANIKESWSPTGVHTYSALPDNPNYVKFNRFMPVPESRRDFRQQVPPSKTVVRFGRFDSEPAVGSEKWKPNSSGRTPETSNDTAAKPSLGTNVLLE